MAKNPGTFTKDAKGRILFRHPLVVDAAGYGKNVCRSIAKLPKGVQGEVEEGLEKLFELKPRLRANVGTEKIHPTALSIWFDPLTGAARQEEANATFAALRIHSAVKGKHLAAFLSSIGNPPSIPFDKLEEFIDGLVGQIVTLEALANRTEAENATLKNQLKGIVEKTGIQTEERAAITIQDAVEHFERNVQCKSETAKKELLRRVKTTCAAFGTTRRYCELTRAGIQDAVRGLCAETTTEYKYKLRDMKRFCRDLAMSIECGGLNMPNPAEGIKPGTPERQEVETLDPLKILALEMLSDYWKALAAVLGFGGLRLSEAAGLRWDDVDFTAKVLRIRKSNWKPRVKNNNSERDTICFKNIWPILESWKKQATHELVFPRIWTKPGGENRRIVNAANESWFESTTGNIPELSGVFKSALETAGMAIDAPALKLRHFYMTTMQTIGKGGLLDSVGGNSAAVRSKHYIRHQSVVAENAGTMPELKAGK